jgi:hypothetical protein
MAKCNILVQQRRKIKVLQPNKNMEMCRELMGAMRELKKDEQLQNIPVVVYPTSTHHCHRAGAKDRCLLFLN